jgi:hypothetical protein
VTPLQKDHRLMQRLDPDLSGAIELYSCHGMFG